MSFFAESELGGCLIARKSTTKPNSVAFSLRWNEVRWNKSLFHPEVGASHVVEQTIRLYDSAGKKDFADDWRRKALRILDCIRPYV